MGKYELTIIMSCYNQETYLSQAIDSVLSQDVSFPFQLIITDDCSCEDNSREVIRSYASRHANIEPIFSAERGGYLRNVLRAKERARTKYLCLLDADDYWTDTSFLQRAHDFLEAHGDHAIYEANVLVISEGGEAIRPLISQQVKPGTYTKEMLLGNRSVPITQTTGMFLRNSIFSRGIPQVMRDAVGTRSERSFEGDTGRFMMHINEGPVYYDSNIVGTYRLTSNGLWSGLSKARQCLATARMSQDYYDYFGSNPTCFVNRAYASLLDYLDEKRNEFASLSKQGEFVDECERLTVEDVYRFCREHEGELERKRDGFVSRARKAAQILRA